MSDIEGAARAVFERIKNICLFSIQVAEFDKLIELRDTTPLDIYARSLQLWDPENGATVMHMAASQYPATMRVDGEEIGAVGFFAIPWQLSEVFADVNAQDNWGETPLHFAASMGCEPAIKQLLLAGADPSIEDEDGRNAYSVAEANNQKAVVDIMRELSSCVKSARKV